MSTPKSAALTERQLDLITRAHLDSNGLIEPLLKLKGGAKLKMIASLAQRALIAQIDGQWRLTPAAVAIVKGDATALEAVPSTLANASAPTLVHDPEIETAVAAAEASWQHEHLNTTAAQPKNRRPESKQALVIEMLKRPEGATIAQISEATGWQAHTVRGTFAGAIKKKLGMIITSDKAQGGVRTYRAAA